ncbi:hypothetical protein NQZ68_019865 [Dissostichus eleginoides]|nr:hypothetical protein NQZ68_019865 [Dissostichus eleginoides]
MLSGYLADMATGLVLVEQLRLDTFFQRAGTGGQWTLGLRKEEDWELGVEGDPVLAPGVWGKTPVHNETHRPLSHGPGASRPIITI